MNRRKSIHFVGIKGVGMVPLALIAKEAGFTVSGCDIADTFITDEPLTKSRIITQIGFNKQHLANIDLVITTGAHGGYDNPEVKTAVASGIPVLAQGKAVGEFMDGKIFNKQFQGISVAGCHGKTTTTAMIATIFKEAGYDPSYVIGASSSIPLGLPGHFGHGTYFIAEADEYATEPIYDKTPKFLWQHPKFLIITNIEYDHPDLYPTIDDVRRAYELFVKKIELSGNLIVNGDDIQSQKLLENYNRKIKIFGFNSHSYDYVIENWHSRNEHTIFSIKNIGEFVLSVSGKHNVMNATAAIITAIEAEIPLEKVKTALTKFKGTKRRLEFIGYLPSGAYLYDDYAHHPTEIVATLQGLRQLHPSKKIICIFQPHTYSRTKLLLEEFSYSFISIDDIIITEIFPSAREPIDSSFSARRIAELIITNSQNEKYNKESVLFLPKLKDVVKYINQKRFGKDTVIITMGAGDVYKIGEKVVKS